MADPDPQMTLAEYLRDVALLKGTKVSCAEGGCGACTVDVVDPASTTQPGRAINACLQPLCSVDQLTVTTIEGLGGGSKELHPIQKKLAETGGRYAIASVPPPPAPLPR